MSCRAYLGRCGCTRFLGIAARQDDLVPLRPRMDGCEQQPAHRLELPGQPELAIELRGQAARSDRQLSRRQQYPECDRQIESSALLGQLGRSEAHRDAARRKAEAGIYQRGAHALLALLDDGGRQSHDAKGREATGETHLDLHQRRV
jgi:hypothetical protein